MKIIRKDKGKEKIFGNLTIGAVFTTENNELYLKVQDSDIIENTYDLEKNKIIYVPPFEIDAGWWNEPYKKYKKENVK